jgi:hypothetical protein
MFWDLMIWFIIIGALFWTVLVVLVVRKAGYTGWQGVCFLVPVVNAGLFIWFALAEWPIQREMCTLKARQAEQKHAV